MTHTKYEFNLEALTQVINSSSRLYLQTLVDEKIISEDQFQQAIQYSIIPAPASWIQTFLSYLGLSKSQEVTSLTIVKTIHPKPQPTDKDILKSTVSAIFSDSKFKQGQA